MEKQTTNKIVTVSFLSSAVVAYIVVEVLFRSLAGAFGAVQRLYSVDVVSHGLPIVVAILTFATLQFNAKTVAWAEDVVLEVSKVVFPSRKDTIGMTVVVGVMVFIASIILFLIDNVAREAVNLLIR